MILATLKIILKQQQPFKRHSHLIYSAQIVTQQHLMQHKNKRTQSHNQTHEDIHIMDHI